MISFIFLSSSFICPSSGLIVSFSPVMPITVLHFPFSALWNSHFVHFVVWTWPMNYAYFLPSSLCCPSKPPFTNKVSISITTTKTRALTLFFLFPLVPLALLCPVVSFPSFPPYIGDVFRLTASLPERRRQHNRNTLTWKTPLCWFWLFWLIHVCVSGGVEVQEGGLLTGSRRLWVRVIVT